MKTSFFSLIVSAITLCVSAPALSSKGVEVILHNYVRAETDMQMQTYVDKFDCFGKLFHVREAYDVTSTNTIRPNRDTIYSWGVFDVTSPLAIELPPPGGRYQSLMVVTQDHSIWAEYGPQKVVLNQALTGTNYVLLLVRTFLDPNDEADVRAAHALQDAIKIEQGNKGMFQVPNWDLEEVESMRNSLNILAPFATDSSKTFGLKKNLDPLYWLLGAAVGWGGLPARDSTYTGGFPDKNDGKTAYTMTIRDVPVDAFWSVTVYNQNGMFAVNDHDSYSFNSATAEPNADGSITLRFGGDSSQPNYLHIVPGWNYVVRMYKPQKEILNGSWTFPKPIEVE